MLLRRRTSGFTLIELAIVLGVVGILGAGMWRMMSAGGQQTKDIATATQHAALISAVKGYLADTTANGGNGGAARPRTRDRPRNSP